MLSYYNLGDCAYLAICHVCAGILCAADHAAVGAAIVGFAWGAFVTKGVMVAAVARAIRAARRELY